MNNETTFGREPVQIVEIVTPKCANVHGVGPCTATQTGSLKCFNTRSTCNAIANYQARPLSHLTPDLNLTDGEAIVAASIDRTASAFIEVDVRVGAGATGTIFAVGSASNFLYLGITSGSIVLAAGGTTAADQARATVATSVLEGRTLTLIAEVDYAADTVRLYEFDPVELELSLLATGTAGTGLPATWAASTNGTVGGDSGITYGSEGGGAYSGSITAARVYTNQAATLTPDADAYRQRYFFDDGRKARPSDDIYILPMLTGVSTVGSRINLTGTDGRYEPLGRRAFADVQFADAPHSDHPYDPYRTDRGYDPLKRSTFWVKWLQRNKFGKTRGLVRLYHGYKGQSLAQMTRQTYVLDKIDLSREAVSMSCRDFLSLTEFRRAQVPLASPGSLNVAILAADTTLTLGGDQLAFYPATGTLRVDEEILTYTGRSFGAEVTTFTGLVRGTDGSTADDHSELAAAQVCRRYTGASIDTVLEELIVSDAQVPAQVVDLAGLTAMYLNALTAYTVTTLITEPTGVDQLIGELAEQCSFYIWWNERKQLVDFQAIIPLSGVDYELSQEADIIADTFELTERPKERVTTISFFYNPRDYAGDLSKPENFKNQLIISNSTASGPDQYGVLPQTREIFSRWLTTEAQANQTGSRYSLRYADVPNYARFLVDAKDREIWVGDFVSIAHDYLADARGNRDASRRWLVIEADEAEPGHSQMLLCVDITLDGQTYVITENGIGNYTAALFGAGNAFIASNAGLNSDGSTGATIG